MKKKNDNSESGIRDRLEKGDVALLSDGDLELALEYNQRRLEECQKQSEEWLAMMRTNKEKCDLFSFALQCKLNAEGKRAATASIREAKSAIAGATILYARNEGTIRKLNDRGALIVNELMKRKHNAA